MSKLHLTLALERYDRHLPLMLGEVQCEGVDLRVLHVAQAGGPADRHERMIHHREFDVCELSLSSYLMAKARGAPLTAIPVFPRRLFSQSCMYVNRGAGIRSPQDLVGKRVGLNTYKTTLSVLAKGDLQHEYGVPVEKVTWVTAREETVAFTPPPKVHVESAPPGTTLDELLVRGEIQALILPRVPRVFVEADPRVARLFPDAKTEEVAYFRRNGFYPIMHVVALKEEVLHEHPWVAGNLMAAFAEAKRLCRGYYSDPNWSFLAWTRLMVEEQKELLGADPWPDNVSGNQKNLERFATYSFEQGLLPQKLSVDSIFAESTRDS